jgi:hypothetical protein
MEVCPPKAATRRKTLKLMCFFVAQIVMRWPTVWRGDGHGAGVSGDGMVYTSDRSKALNLEVEVFLAPQIVREMGHHQREGMDMQLE